MKAAVRENLMIWTHICLYLKKYKQFNLKSELLQLSFMILLSSWSKIPWRNIRDNILKTTIINLRGSSKGDWEELKGGHDRYNTRAEVRIQSPVFSFFPADLPGFCFVLFFDTSILAAIECELLLPRAPTWQWREESLLSVFLPLLRYHSYVKSLVGL